jgi:putative transposase
LSATNIARLTGVWEEEYREFRKRRLEDRDYVYVWADGVHFNVRLEEERLCTLVLIGARADGQKELITVEDGYRESAESWKTVLRDLKRCGMQAPVLAVGDGALGFWEAVREVWPETREQRDWCHKIANVLDKLPKRLQGRAKRALHEIMYAETCAQAEQGIKAFVAEFSPKYEKAVDCLIKDREALLAFFDFPAEHWKHLRTSNPIESSFATVRLRV